MRSSSFAEAPYNIENRKNIMPEIRVFLFLCIARVPTSLYEKERASPPGQFIALKAINELKGTISG